MEIEREKVFPLLFVWSLPNLLLCVGVVRTRVGDDIRRHPYIFRQTCLSLKIQFSPSHKNFGTLHPKRWSTEDVCAWATGRGSDFCTAGGTLLQNGVDGDTIYDVLSDTSVTNGSCDIPVR